MAIHSGTSQSAHFLPPHITLDDLATTFVTSSGHPLEVSLDIEPTPLPLRIRPAVVKQAKRVVPPTPKVRRELTAKGNEGSRRRQRWENDRLLSNPYLTPPTAADFVPGPTYPKKVVHYELAQLYNPSSSSKSNNQKRKNQAQNQIPKDLKQKLKHARGAIGLVRMLEERIRDSLLLPPTPNSPLTIPASMNSSQHLDESEPWEKLDIDREIFSEEEGHESDKEYIVFVPKRKLAQRKSSLSASVIGPIPSTAAAAELVKAMPIYHSDPKEPTAPFARWLVHSIAEYYGCRSWSCVGEDGTGRVAWVEGKSVAENSLPKLLWEML